MALVMDICLPSDLHCLKSRLFCAFGSFWSASNANSEMSWKRYGLITDNPFSDFHFQPFLMDYFPEKKMPLIIDVLDF